MNLPCYVSFIKSAKFIRGSIFILPLLVFYHPAHSADRNDKVIIPKLMSQTPRIDGVIDSLWNDVDSVSDFFQLQPYFNQPPSRRTVVKVLTTRDALYCLMICYDDRKNIQNVTGTLDNTAGDIVSVMLDTFNDNRTAYKLAVTASGTRADCRLVDDARDRDYNWDGIWRSASKIYDWCFIVEWEVPYKSLKYGKGLKAWGLDFDRYSPTRSEDLYWASYEQSEGQRISKFGQLLFQDFYPSTDGLNLEVYPVGIAKTSMVTDNVYHSEGSAGLDLFYNPSEQLTLQATANPDFAQIEADPYSFNISRYETYYNERRPFFTQGNEIFIAAGKERNTGFYRPLELLYSRRIGKKLPDGSEVPLDVGAKAFGRADAWEYGAFMALTGEKDYSNYGAPQTEQQAQFGALRFKRQMFDNSSIGGLFVGKHDAGDNNSVLDIDGAFRVPSMQLSYQVARSDRNGNGGFASSVGLVNFGDTWFNLWRSRIVQDGFDVSEIGYVPWTGTANLVGLSGPQWYFKTGPVRSFMFGFGPALNYKKIEGYTDYLAITTINMQFRSNWGWEIDADYGPAKDNGVNYTYGEIDWSTWFNVSAAWSADFYGTWAKTYNFDRDYVAYYTSVGFDFDWRATTTLDFGTSGNAYIEQKPDNSLQDITYNARPYFSVTPVNDLNVRVYVDNLYLRSTEQMQHVITGFLVSYNFLPKSWIYFALNDVRDRSDEVDAAGNLLPNRMHVTAQAAVGKIKYLYYF